MQSHGTFPTCEEPEVCTAPADTNTPENLAVIEQGTGCTRKLPNVTNSLLWSGGNNFGWYDGSADLPIILDQLQEIGSGAPRLITQNGAGVIGHWLAPSGTTKKVITGYSGQWQVEDWTNRPCFDEDDICECSPTYYAGFQRNIDADGVITWCLVRFTPEEEEAEPIFFESTDTVLHTGDGTAADPHRFHVRVSFDAGNIVEARDDGIFVECCVTYDDVLDLL